MIPPEIGLDEDDISPQAKIVSGMSQVLDANITMLDDLLERRGRPPVPGKMRQRVLAAFGEVADYFIGETE